MRLIFAGTESEKRPTKRIYVDTHSHSANVLQYELEERVRLMLENELSEV